MPKSIEEMKAKRREYSRRHYRKMKAAKMGASSISVSRSTFRNLPKEKLAEKMKKIADIIEKD